MDTNITKLLAPIVAELTRQRDQLRKLADHATFVGSEMSLRYTLTEQTRDLGQLVSELEDLVAWEEKDEALLGAYLAACSAGQE